MYRTATLPNPTLLTRGINGVWLARRWYYTPRTRRQYSVRQIAPGDRRLLAEFALTLNGTAIEREQGELDSMSSILFDRVLAAGDESAVGFAALESTAAGDRVIGIAAYTPSERDRAAFTVAVTRSYREELVGRTLLSTLLRHARRAGVARLEAEIHWANRPMHMLALSMGFGVHALPRDRMRRQLSLHLK